MEKKETVTKAMKEAAKEVAGSVTTVAAVKAAQEKMAAEVKAPEKKEAEKKEPEKKAAEPKSAEKEKTADIETPKEKAPVKKAAAKKPAAKKAETKKAEAVQEVFVQYGGQEIMTNDVLEKAKAAYVAEGHRASAIKSIRIYINMEEGMAYYVINGKPAGSISLF